MTPMEECGRGLQQWKRLGWLPYCPKGVRKHIPWFADNPFMPYNYIKWKSSGKLQFFYD